MRSMSLDAAPTRRGAEPLRRLERVCDRVQAAREHAEQLTAERDALLVALAAAGVPYASLAEASGLTPGRVAQLVARSRRAD